MRGKSLVRCVHRVELAVELLVFALLPQAVDVGADPPHVLLYFRGRRLRRLVYLILAEPIDMSEQPGQIRQRY